MPWPRASDKGAYAARMYTFSWPHLHMPPALVKAWKDRMHRAVCHASQFAMPKRIIPFFEVSEEGYQHCHLIIGFSRSCKFAKFWKVIRSWQFEAHAPQTSNACHVVPRLESLDEASRKVMGKLGPYALMHKYCTDPSKKKSIDADGLTWISPPPPPRPTPPPNPDFWWMLENVLLPRLHYDAPKEYGYMHPGPRPKPGPPKPELCAPPPSNWLIYPSAKSLASPLGKA